jgi:hypothetical protein
MRKQFFQLFKLKHIKMKTVLTYTANIPAMPMNGLGNGYAPADYSLGGTSMLCFNEIL